jgi:tetratricopeptide (TPR) repeat protein
MSKRKHQIETFFRQAQQVHAAGRLAEADQLYRQLLNAVPNHADSLHMLGVVALQSGQPDAALQWFDRAIARHQSSAPAAALINAHRAHALLALRRADDALAAAQHGLQARRNCAEAAFAMGHALSDLGRPDEAIAAYQTALRHNPALPDLANSLALALVEANRLEDAVAVLTEAVRRQPDDAIARLNLASALKDLGRIDAAEAQYRDLLRRHPNDPTAHYNLGVLLLLAGRYAEAWPEWDWRFQADPTLARKVGGQLWQGEPLDGRTLLIYAEQGIGDSLQFCRYLPLLPRDGRVLLEVHAPLVRLLTHLPGFATVAAIGDPLARHDLSCPLLSLPRLLGTQTEADIPAPIPYLHADPALVAQWRQRTERLPGLRVGIVWAGNPSRSRMDRHRSVPAAVLAALAEVPNVSLVSLQVGAAAADLHATVPAGTVHDWTADLADFTDTAALTETLDLVIGVDTAVVHLAGALGKPVWLLNRSDTCWRWLLGREDSPWYPTLRQFRQPRAGDWPSVMNQVRTALTAASSSLAGSGHEADQGR